MSHSKGSHSRHRWAVDFSEIRRQDCPVAISAGSYKFIQSHCSLFNICMHISHMPAKVYPVHILSPSVKERTKVEVSCLHPPATCTTPQKRRYVTVFTYTVLSLVPRPKQPQRRSLAEILQVIFAGVVWVWERDYTVLMLQSTYSYRMYCSRNRRSLLIPVLLQR